MQRKRVSDAHTQDKAHVDMWRMPQRRLQARKSGLKNASDSRPQSQQAPRGQYGVSRARARNRIR
eukprot:2258661-Alexandrium_andersonii.AAC.1